MDNNILFKTRVNQLLTINSRIGPIFNICTYDVYFNYLWYLLLAIWLFAHNVMVLVLQLYRICNIHLTNLDPSSSKWPNVRVHNSHRHSNIKTISRIWNARTSNLKSNDVMYCEPQIQVMPIEDINSIPRPKIVDCFTVGIALPCTFISYLYI